MNQVIYGAGDFAIEVLDYLRRDDSLNIIGYYTDEGINTSFEEYSNLTYFGLFEKHESEIEVILAFADPKSRKHVLEKLQNCNFRLATFIHPTAVISPTAKLMPGVIVFPYCVVSCNAFIDVGVVLNSYVGVGHHVNIGRGTVISSQVDVTGHVKIGNFCFLGSGSRIAPRKKIGDESQISLGVAVIRNVPANTIVMPTSNKLLK